MQISLEEPSWAEDITDKWKLLSPLFENVSIQREYFDMI